MEKSILRRLVIFMSFFMLPLALICVAFETAREGIKRMLNKEDTKDVRTPNKI